MSNNEENGDSENDSTIHEDLSDRDDKRKILFCIQSDGNITSGDEDEANDGIMDMKLSDSSEEDKKNDNFNL